MKRINPRLSKIFLLIIVFYVTAWLFVTFIKSPCNIEKAVGVNIFPGENQEQVLEKLQKAGRITNPNRLTFLLNLMDYDKKVHVGHYVLKPGISNFRIARILISGLQTPVRLTFNNVRTVEDLAGRLSKQLMADSISLLDCFRERSWMYSMDLKPETYMCIFLPNTYEMWWNVTPVNVLALFQKEYKAFWDENRTSAAKKIGLTPVEVSTLASIVEEETNQADEMPKVAGLYLNRLRIDMPLQADPTIKFAVGDFTIKRIMIGHTKVSSPYNTYKYTGLPPGPIRIPSIRAIEAVLTPKRHSYLFMCAKNDFSGYHAFATTLSQHNKNAAAYHHALNDYGIMR